MSIAERIITGDQRAAARLLRELTIRSLAPATSSRLYPPTCGLTCLASRVPGSRQEPARSQITALFGGWSQCCFWRRSHQSLRGAPSWRPHRMQRHFSSGVYIRSWQPGGHSEAGLGPPTTW